MCSKALVLLLYAQQQQTAKETTHSRDNNNVWKIEQDPFPSRQFILFYQIATNKLPKMQKNYKKSGISKTPRHYEYKCGKELCAQGRKEGRWMDVAESHKNIECMFVYVWRRQDTRDNLRNNVANSFLKKKCYPVNLQWKISMAPSSI